MDLAGTAFEWVLDGYQEDWYAQPEASAPDSCNLANTTPRVIRGGAALSSFMRSAYRFPANPTKPSGDLTFRCARSPQ